MLAWLIKSFLAVSSCMPLVNKQLACQNLHKLNPGRNHKREEFGNVARSISLFSLVECNPLFVHWLETVWAVHWLLHVEIAVQTLKRGTKGNPIFRILCWNYAIVVQNTNIITHTTHNVHDEDCKRMKKKKNIWERHAESKTWEQWICLLGSEKHVYQKTYSR